MNLLTTVCRAGEGNNWDVYWRNGVQNQGLISVSVTASVDDPEIVAELSALQWILEHRSVFGVTQAGKGMCLTVSSGAIKKLAKAAEKSGGLKESTLGKRHLFPYARFLGTRFVGAEIQVSKDDSWIRPRAQNHIETLTIAEPLPEILDMKGVGLVELSAHAMEQFAKRQAGGDREDTWRFLRKAASSGLRLANLDQERLQNQANRHGAVGQTWVHDETRWAFVIVPGERLPVMVTAFAIRKSVAG